MPHQNPFRQPLMILPFDHRSSFSRDLLGYSGKLTAKQRQKVKELKTIVFYAFALSIKGEKHPAWFGVLIDEEYGSDLLRKAKRLGVSVSLTTEKSGREEYQFEYGKKFLNHIQKFKPDYVKALVRYNPANTEINHRQLAKLKRLSDACGKHGYDFLLELLVSPTASDLERVGSKAAFDLRLRPELTVRAIREIKTKVKVDVWKLEGVPSSSWNKILSAIGPKARVIVLGRGEGKAQVRQWLKDAARYDQIIGFAVGRTIFTEPLGLFLKKRLTRDETVKKIAAGFKSYVRLWLRMRRN